MRRFSNTMLTALLLYAICALTVFALRPEKPAPSHHTSKGMEVSVSRPADAHAKEYRHLQEELRSRLEAYFEKAIRSRKMVGAGVSIVLGDSIVFSDGFGKRKSRGKEKVNGATVFRLGSLSKGFTGILGAKLRQEGLLNWSDRVSDCIPDFTLGSGANARSITLANLLSHSSGAPYHSFTNLIEAGLPIEEIVPRFANVNPISPPGRSYSYQNALFALAGTMMAKASGQTFQEALQDRLFDPLGMCSTSMDHKKLLAADNVAIPHVRKRYGWKALKLRSSYYNALPAGGINANADDMARWMRFLLGHNPEVMDRTQLVEAFTPVIRIPGRIKYYQRWEGHLESYYGLGWRIHQFADDQATGPQTVWHHGGSVNNFRNEVALYPGEDIGICVLMNSNSPLARTVIPDLHEIVRDIFLQRPDLLVYNQRTAQGNQ